MTGSRWWYAPRENCFCYVLCKMTPLRAKSEMVFFACWMRWHRICREPQLGEGISLPIVALCFRHWLLSKELSGSTILFTLFFFSEMHAKWGASLRYVTVNTPRNTPMFWELGNDRNLYNYINVSVASAARSPRLARKTCVYLKTAFTMFDMVSNRIAPKYSNRTCKISTHTLPI